MAKPQSKRTSVNSAMSAKRAARAADHEERGRNGAGDEALGERRPPRRGAPLDAARGALSEVERAGVPAGQVREVAQAVRAALDKKAQDVVILDLRQTPAFTDFFILCSGLSQRQVKAIADAIEETLRSIKVRPAHTEGYDRAEWILMDYFTFVVHVFTPQTRAFYSLERLWGDAERIDVSDEGPPK